MPITSPKINQSRDSYLELSFMSRKQSLRFTGKHTATSVLSQTERQEDERRIRSLAVPNKTTMF